MTNWLTHPLRSAAAMACLFAGIGFASAATAGNGFPPEGAPTKNKGLTLTKLGEIPPGMIETAVGLRGHHLIVRMLSVAPGGQIRAHDHVGHPGLVAVIDGELVDARETGEVTHAAGGAVIIEDENTVHWLYNRSDAPVRAVLCDLRPPVRQARWEDGLR